MRRLKVGPGFRDHEAGASIWLMSLVYRARSKVRTEGQRTAFQLEPVVRSWKDCLPLRGTCAR